VTSWVLEAWRSLPEEMVARSFKKCGISNSIDGTEDDILLEEDANPEQESADNESEDEDLYDDQLTEEQWQSLFGESDDEDEFNLKEFSMQVCVLKKTTAPIGAAKSEKSQ